MMSKKGIGTVVAWVLLLGFSIGLATTVFLWMTKQTEDITKSSVRYVEGSMQCDNVMINVAVDKELVVNPCNLTVTNTRYLNIKQISFRKLDPQSPKSYIYDEKVLEPKSTGKPPDKYTMTISDFGGETYCGKVEVMPIINVDDDLVACKNKAVTVNCKPCPVICTPDTCASLGKNCGNWLDGCGGTLSCGSCTVVGQTCNTNGQCVVCTTTTCLALGKNCGSWPDGCGGTLSCGSCPVGQTCKPDGSSCAAVVYTCTDDGTPYGQCSLITPPKYCDNGNLIDRCVGTPDCGDCPAGYICQLDGSCLAVQSQGYYSPNTVVNDNSIGNLRWKDEGNAKSSDDSYATATPSGTKITNYLKATNFSFSIPNDASITGIEVEVERKGDNFTGSQGPNSGSIFVNDATVGTVSWLSPGNAVASDDSWAETSGGLKKNDISNYLKATGFGFSIPTGVTIDGIRVGIERHAGGATALEDYSVKMVKDGTIQGTDNAESGYWGTSDSNDNHGGSSDLWGLTWTAADINAADFGVVVSVWGTLSSLYYRGYIDYIKITVYYTDIVSGVQDNRVSIVKSSGSIGTTNKALSGKWPTSDGTVTYGGPSDLWGETLWTPADINNTNFGVAVSASASSKAYIDYTKIKVYYTQG